jgi:hypothetical protein
MLAIEQLSRAEKLQMMEALWRDLSGDEAALVSPNWHEAALKEADQAVAGGEAHFIDWTTAKDILRKGSAT